MKTLFILSLLLGAPLIAQEAARAPLAVNGAPHPRARITSVDAAAGTFIFAWLNAKGQPVDSGGSIGRFTPVILTPAADGKPAIYAEPAEATLIAGVVAAAAPQASPPPTKSEPQRLADLEAEVAALKTAAEAAPK